MTLEKLGFKRWNTPHTYKVYYRKKTNNDYEVVLIDLYRKKYKIMNVANTTQTLIKAAKNKIKELVWNKELKQLV